MGGSADEKHTRRGNGKNFCIDPDFIKKIIVHAPEKSSGKRKQEIEIIFNFVGQVEIPVLTESIILERVPKGKKTA
ncbi:MAG: DUF4368 domain-containing protein [Clostridia bacterium]|nr:DUF4368 domain-containing protein [Clostridia bacterium]